MQLLCNCMYNTAETVACNINSYTYLNLHGMLIAYIFKKKNSVFFFNYYSIVQVI